MKRKQFGKCFVSIALAALTAVSFSACGQTAPSVSEKPVSKVANPMEKYSQSVTISIGRQTATNPRLPKGDSYENNAYTRFLKENLNIVIKDAFEANGADYDRQVSLAMTGDSLPDMMLVDNYSDLKELVDNGQIMDLTAVYNQYADDKIKAIYNSYEKVYQGGAFGRSTFDGKIMAMPEVSGDSGPNAVWIRQDWADSLGIKLDADGDGCITADELKNLAKQFVAKDPGKTGKPVGIPVQPYPTDGSNDGGAFTLTGIANSFHAFPKHWVKDSDGKVVYGSTTNETKEFLTTMASWFKDGILDPQTGARTFNDCQALLVNGQAGIAFGQWHMPDWCLNLVKQKDPKAEFRLYAIADKSGKVNCMHVAPSDKYLVIRKGYDHPEAVIKIMNLFYDIFLGKNATNVMPNINQALQMDNTTMPINMAVFDANMNLRSYQQITSALKDPSKISDIDSVEDRMIVSEIAAYNKDPKAATAENWSHYTSRLHGIGLFQKLTDAKQINWEMPGFIGTTESMASMWTNLSKLEDESVIKIITGAEPPSSFDSFVSSWKSEGGNQITSEVQAQISGK